MAHVKPTLEGYIAENILPHYCIYWFFYAEAYQMKYLEQKAIKMMISRFGEISTTEDYTSLSLEQLHVLFDSICRTEHNPAFLKFMRNTLGTIATTEQTTKQEIQQLIETSFASSFFLIGHCKGETNMKIFSVNLTSHTVSEIGTVPERQHVLLSCLACYVTDSHIFYVGWIKCMLLDLVTLNMTNLPQYPDFPSPKLQERAIAVAVGTKVYVIRGRRCRVHCLDLIDKKWTMCAPRQITRLVCAVGIGAKIFVLFYGCDSTHKLLGALVCYDTVTDTWSTKADPPFAFSHKQADAVAVNKDLYYVSREHSNNRPLILRYSTIVDEWTHWTAISENPLQKYQHPNLSEPPLQNYYHATALCVNGKLVLCCSVYTKELKQVKHIQVYDSSTGKWEISQVKLPQELTVDFACAL